MNCFRFTACAIVRASCAATEVPALPSANIPNQRFLLEESNTFGGTHDAAPRQVSKELEMRSLCIGILTSIAFTVSLHAQQILFAQIAKAPPINSNQFTDISGLSFDLPATSPGQNTALVILNVPMAFANGDDFPDVVFGIAVDAMLVATGGFTSQTQRGAAGRVPTTLVVRVPLTSQPQFVRGQWSSVRGSTGNIDSFSSLSSILGTQ